LAVWIHTDNNTDPQHETIAVLKNPNKYWVQNSHERNRLAKIKLPSPAGLVFLQNREQKTRVRIRVMVRERAKIMVQCQC